MLTISELGKWLTETVDTHGLPIEITLSRSQRPELGDFSTPLAMSLFAANRQLAEPVAALTAPSPVALADQLAAELRHSLTQSPSLQAAVATISTAAPGFINFTMSETWLRDGVVAMSQLNNEQPIVNLGNGRPAVVEYSSPNIAKPFTIGHLRSTIIGDAVANLLVAADYQVFRDNHLGDWGTQFGKLIYAIKTWGDEAALDASSQPVKDLVELYVKFHTEAEQNPALEDEGRAWFKKLEDHDSEARRLWQKCIDWSWVEFDKLYDKLGVSFTENGGRGYGESFFESMMPAIIQELQTKGLAKESEGALVIFYPDDELPPLMIRKKDGATLYATRDLATDKFRLDHYGPDVLVVNEVGAEQEQYFRQLYRAEALLGWYQPDQRVHVKHGLYRFKDKKMSTRKGNVIWLEEVLNEAFERVKAMAGERIDDDTAWAIGIGALKWQDLRRSSHLDVVFDWDEILSLEGNSGPYLQYTYVRCHSLLTKASDQKSTISNDNDIVFDTLNESEKDLAKKLGQFAESFELAVKEFAPHHLCTYLYHLAQTFNSFYTNCPVLAETVTPAERQRRLLLTTATARIVQRGLHLLGIQTVTQM